MDTYSVKKIFDLFSINVTKTAFLKAEATGSIPLSQRHEIGVAGRRVWRTEDLPLIGARYGFLKPFSQPVVLTIFTTKGGVFKTTLALNVARMAALHNIKTCVVGLDLQGDISRALGLDADIEESSDFKSAVTNLKSSRGLFHFHQKMASLEEILHPTDIPTLSFIPETPELIQLEQMLSIGHRREYWLRDNVITPLTKHFELIILDCAPSWNRLVTNAIVSCDFLLSPLECRINNFRNLEAFQSLMNSFRTDMKLDFDTMFVPTRANSTRKLSNEIKAWYLGNVEGCLPHSIREGIQGDEAMAARKSLPEYMSKSLQCEEMKEVLLELWKRIENGLKQKASKNL